MPLRFRQAALLMLLFLVFSVPALASLISQDQEIQIGREGSRQLEQR